MFRRASPTWALCVSVAILNGVIRQAVNEPVVGELTAHQISIVIASMAFVAVTYAMLHTEAACADDRALLRVGATWAASTTVL